MVVIVLVFFVFLILQWYFNCFILAALDYLVFLDFTMVLLRFQDSIDRPLLRFGRSADRWNRCHRADRAESLSYIELCQWFCMMFCSFVHIGNLRGRSVAPMATLAIWEIGHFGDLGDRRIDGIGAIELIEPRGCNIYSSANGVA